MDITTFKKSIYVGMEFQKVRVKSMIIDIHADGFIYAIGRRGQCKKVSFVEILAAIEEIEGVGEINNKWYRSQFPQKAKTNPCNFTSIGSVLQALGYVKYVGNGCYKK